MKLLDHIQSPSPSLAVYSIAADYVNSIVIILIVMQLYRPPPRPWMGQDVELEVSQTTLSCGQQLAFSYVVSTLTKSCYQLPSGAIKACE